MRETLRLLYRLQQIDSRALELERAAEQVPPRVSELETLTEAMRTELGALRTEHEQQDRERRDSENTIKDETAKVQKWERRLQDIKTPREYQALSREVDQSKRQIRDLEDRVVELMEAIEGRNSVIAEKETELRTLEGELAEKVRDLRQRQAKLNAEANQIRRGRDEIAAKVPKNALNLYNKVRERRGGVALSIISGSKCSGCNVEVRPQQILEMRRLETIEQCPTCQRILMHESLAQAEDEAAAKPQEGAT